MSKSADELVAWHQQRYQILSDLVRVWERRGDRTMRDYHAALAQLHHDTVDKLRCYMMFIQDVLEEYVGQEGLTTEQIREMARRRDLL